MPSLLCHLNIDASVKQRDNPARRSHPPGRGTGHAHTDTIMKKVIAFQIEPQRLPVDCGGFSAKVFRACGVSCAATYDFHSKLINVYDSTTLTDLGKALRAADSVLGYNCLNFDHHLLAGSRVRVASVRWLDLCQIIGHRLGHTRSLDDVLQEIGVSAMESPSLPQRRRWLKERNQAKLTERCVNGARGIAKIFEHMRDGGTLTSGEGTADRKLAFEDLIPRKLREMTR